MTQQDLIFSASIERGGSWPSSETVPSSCQVTIKMSQDSASKLSDGGFYLYGFKAVQSSDQAGRPLVWFRTTKYATNTVVGWSGQYQAYTSLSQIQQNVPIAVAFGYGIALGQTLKVDQKSGSGEVVKGGPETAISIHNTTSTPFSSGISQTPQPPRDDTSSPVCAFPLYGGFVDAITPIEKVLLLFSTRKVEPGTVIVSTFETTAEILNRSASLLLSISPGFLIDLNGALDNRRAVSFDINDGWGCSDCTWAQPVSATADLVPLLIEKPSSSSKERLK